jgi:hypothetical protein
MCAGPAAAIKSSESSLELPAFLLHETFEIEAWNLEVIADVG